MEPKVITFSTRITGYCDKDTNFKVSRKFQGTAPDITIWQSGKYSGQLTLDTRTAKELARTLLYVCGEETK